MTRPDDPCTLLEWDTQFFSKTIGRVCESRLDPATVARIDEWAGKHRVECLYYLAPADDPASCQLAEASGFRFVDIRTTLERDGRIAPGEPGANVRRASQADEASLIEIARTAHTDSRFFADGHFPIRDCERLYETWISKSLAGSSQAVFVADDGAVSGYITCQIDPTGQGRIGLIAVAERARGQGVGSSLLARAIRWFQSEAVERIQVVTQGRNRGALRLYQRSNFMIQSNELWFHRWFDHSIGQRIGMT